MPALDGYVFAQTRHHQLTFFSLMCLPHGNQIAIQNAGIDHAVATHPQQMVGIAAQQGRIAA